MAKDVIFEKGPKKNSATERFLNPTQDELAPLIDAKLYCKLLPTDLIQKGDEFYDVTTSRWVPSHAVGSLVGPQTYVYRRKNF